MLYYNSNNNHCHCCAHVHIQQQCHCQPQQQINTNYAQQNKYRVNVKMQNHEPYDCQNSITMRKREIQQQTNTQNVIDGLLKYNSGLARYLNKYAPKENNLTKRGEYYAVKDPVEADMNIDENNQKYVSIAQQKGLNYGLPGEGAHFHRGQKEPQQNNHQYHDFQQQTSPRVLKQQGPKRNRKPGIGVNKRGNPKDPNRTNQQKIADYYKDLSQASRYLSDTGFRKHFHRQCFQNYGRNNTNGAADGIVYGNYLKTFNINPHSGANFPHKEETYRHALVSGSPQKYEQYKGVKQPDLDGEIDRPNQCEQYQHDHKGFQCEQLQHHKMLRDPSDMDQVIKGSQKYHKKQQKYTNIKLVPRQHEEQQNNQYYQRNQQKSYNYGRRGTKMTNNQRNIIRERRASGQSSGGISGRAIQRTKDVRNVRLPESVRLGAMESPRDNGPQQSQNRQTRNNRYKYIEQPAPAFQRYPPKRYEPRMINPPIICISDPQTQQYCCHASSCDCAQCPEFQQQFKQRVIEQGFKNGNLANNIARYKDHVQCNICTKRHYTKCCCT